MGQISSAYIELTVPSRFASIHFVKMLEYSEKKLSRRSKQKSEAQYLCLNTTLISIFRGCESSITDPNVVKRESMIMYEFLGYSIYNINNSVCLHSMV